MMKISRAVLPAATLALAFSFCPRMPAQTVNVPQAVVLEGLRSTNGFGSFTAAEFGTDGSLFLLLDEHDGVRILKTNAGGSGLLAQVQMGATGDSGLAMALDPGGNLYVTGTSSSGKLAGTSGVAFPAAADTSTNSFVAKYDSNLNLIFLTFLGAGRTAATSVAATSDGVFVTGITFNTAFPVTPAGIQQTPAGGSSENGFVERFSPTGSLVYATYLTGANGNTMPVAIVADSSDNAYVAGATSASGFPTIAALQPLIFASTANSGFLSKLSPAGSSFVFSTFIAGTGLNGMALDAASSSLLLSGNVALGQFPVAKVLEPLTSAAYQTLLRIPSDGQSVTSSLLLVPGTQSFVSVGPNGTAWVSGALTTPLFPGAAAPDFAEGDSFLLHVTAADAIDQTLRFGGQAANNASYASLASLVAAPAVSADGATAALPGTITATVSSSLLSTERYDLPMAATPNAVLPNTLRDVVPSAASCGSSSQCAGTGALLAMVETASSQPSLGISADTLPNVLVRNLGSATATGLVVVASGYTVATNCAASLAASNQCSVALTGTGPGSVTVSTSNAGTYSVALPANTVTADPLALSAEELDFGIQTSVAAAAGQTLTVTNLTGVAQTFSAARDGGAASTPYAFTVSSSDCGAGGAAGSFAVAANAACHLVFSLAVSSSSANDGPVRAIWKVGTRDVVLTAFAQAAALSVSASEIDFGTEFSGTGAIRLPRYLYLSNNSATAIAHTGATLPGASAFAIADGCPSLLEPHSVCRLTLTYQAASAPSEDAITLNLDNGISVLITGSTLPPAGVGGSSANPSLSVTPTAISFATPVIVTGISTGTQTVTVKNTGANAFSLAVVVSGDFTFVNGCTGTLGGGASCQVLVSFAPSQPGVRDGVLSVTAGSGFTPTYVTLTGTGLPLLPANNGTLDLGQALAGEPVIVWYQVQQSVTALTATTGSPQFGVALVANSGAVPTGLPPSAFAQTATGPCNKCYLGVQFLAQTAGSYATTLALSTVAGGSAYPLTLTAVALPVQGLLLTPIAQDFGPVPVNSSSEPLTFTLANLLTPATGVTVQTVSASGDFAVTGNSIGGAACAGSLPSMASCFTGVTFVPTAVGLRSGTLTVVTSGGTVTSSLSGYGSADPGLALNPAALTFQNVGGSAATQQTVTLKNTGQANLAIGTITASNPSFTVGSNCMTLAPGSSCTVTVMFMPQAALVNAALSIPVTATLNGQTSPTTYSVALTGAYTTQGAGLAILPNEVNFGSTAADAAGTTRQFALTNYTSKTMTVALTMPRQFVLTAVAPCPKLAAGASCNFSVTFLPATAGALTGTVIAQGSPVDGSPAVEALAYMLGYGTSQAQLKVASNAVPNGPLNFGQVTSGQSVAQTVTLSNSGTIPLAVRRITSQPPFLSTNNCGIALAPAASCAVVVTYSPVYEVGTGVAANPRSDVGSLVVESDALSSPDAVALTGTASALTSSNPSNNGVIAAFALTQGSLTFATTPVGSVSAAQTIGVTNTGTTTVHFASISVPSDFSETSSCTTLLPGAVCSITVELTPTASGSNIRSGTMEIQSDAATSLEFVSLIGTSLSAPLTLSPAALNFGTVDVGSTASLNVSVTNNSSGPVTFLGLTAGGDYSAASGSCPAFGSTFPAGSTCALTVTFAPSAAGTRAGTLSLTTDATAMPLTVSLTGVGLLATLQVTPGSLAFGSIAVGSPSNLTLTLMNSGGAAVTGIAATVSGPNATDFAVTVPCSTTTLSPNAGCVMTVTFTPSALGSRAATLTIASSDPSGPAVIALSGTGTAGGTFALTVNGAASASMTVVSGSPAVYPLVLTPLNGFAGAVALTCKPIVAGEYASCSLLSSTLTLGPAQNSTATINTITSSSSSMVRVIGLLTLPLAGLVLVSQSRRRRKTVVAMVCAALLCAAVSGCGGKPPVTKSPLLYTPAGTYQYQVTATSTSGAQISSSVTLTLIVQ